jgi:hypothetical protein
MRHREMVMITAVDISSPYHYKHIITSRLEASPERLHTASECDWGEHANDGRWGAGDEVSWPIMRRNLPVKRKL